MGSGPRKQNRDMNSARLIALTAALLSGAATAPAVSEDRPVTVPSGQQDGDRPQTVVREAGANVDKTDDLERARQAARAAGDGSSAAAAPNDKDDDLQRAREAARAADPRLLGIERSRESARTPDHSGGGKDCLSGREARGAITAKRAVTLVQAMRTARTAWEGEVIDYRLCTFDGALAYDLTLLNTEGKVARVRVDADGKLLGVR